MLQQGSSSNRDPGEGRMAVTGRTIAAEVAIG